MHILLIHQYFLEEDDGGGSRWNEITRIWTNEGAKVTVIAGMIHANKRQKRAEYKGVYFKMKQQGNVKVWRCHVSELYNRNFLGRFWGYFTFVFSSLWAGSFKAKERYDVVIVTSPPLFVGITGVIISFIKKLPFVFEVRDLWPEAAIDVGVLKNKLIIKMAYWFEGFIYKKAKLINVLTPAFKKELIEKKNVPEEKIILIPNAADFELSEELLQNFNVSEFRAVHGMEKKMVMIYVGAHGISNHLIQVIEAAEMLNDKPVLFILIGDGMQRKMLQQEVIIRGLKNFRFVESIPKKEIFKYILASDLGMSVLKKVDTFKTVYSNKSFDYMSCKKPILMVIDGVSRKLVEDAEAGIYIEPENPTELKNAVEYYLTHPAAIIQQGQNGYNFAKKNFDRNILAKQYLNLIKELVI